MRLGGGLLLVACAGSLALGGCRARDWTFAPFGAAARHSTTTTGTPIPLSGVDVTESGYGAVSYVVHLPAPPAGAPAQQLVLRFADPLDGTKVQAFARGPTGEQTLVRDKRVGGTDVEIPLGALHWNTVAVVVHHNLRPASILTAVAVHPEGNHARPL